MIKIKSNCLTEIQNLHLVIEPGLKLVQWFSGFVFFRFDFPWVLPSTKPNYIFDSRLNPIRPPIRSSFKNTSKTQSPYILYNKVIPRN